MISRRPSAASAASKCSIREGWRRSSTRLTCGRRQRSRCASSARPAPCFVQCGFRHPQGRKRHHDLVCLRLRRCRQRLLGGNIHGERRFERVLRPQQRIVSRIAFGDRLGHVAERDGEAAIRIGGQSRRVSTHSNLDGLRRPDVRDYRCRRHPKARFWSI
jgi:hypothetical protein